MFFILFGTRPKASVLFTVRFWCRYCGQDVPQQVYVRRTQLTVFFVPLFSFGSRRFVQCSNCGGTTELSEEQVEHARARITSA